MEYFHKNFVFQIKVSAMLIHDKTQYTKDHKWSFSLLLVPFQDFYQNSTWKNSTKISPTIQSFRSHSSRTKFHTAMNLNARISAFRIPSHRCRRLSSTLVKQFPLSPYKSATQYIFQNAEIGFLHVSYNPVEGICWNWILKAFIQTQFQFVGTVIYNKI